MPPGEICKAALSVVRKHLSPLPERCHSVQTVKVVHMGWQQEPHLGFGVCSKQRECEPQQVLWEQLEMKNGGSFLTYSVFVFSAMWVAKASSTVTIAVPKQRAFL